MSVEDVKEYFTERGLDDPTFELDDSGATVELAARTLGVDPGRIAKTLAFKLKDRDIIIVTKGDARVDNKKFKQFFGAKAKMLDHEEVLKVTGHPVGGVCPFGLKNPLDVYIDVSIRDFEYVYPAAGSITTAMKIAPAEIKRLTDGEWVDICQ